MTADNRDNNEWTVIAGVAIAFIAGLAAWHVAPQAFGLVIGLALLAPTVPLGIWDSDPQRSRRIAWCLVGAGVSLAASYYLFDGIIGADLEMHRFLKRWEVTGQDLSVLLRHPWAVIPLTCAAIFAGAGAAIYGGSK